jgi:hypothetical protein
MRTSFSGESSNQEVANDLDSWRNAIRAAAPGATEDQINAKLAEYTNKGSFDPETGQYSGDTVNSQRAFADLNSYLANQNQGGWDWAGKVADSTIGKGRARAEGSFNFDPTGNLDLDEKSLRAYRGSNVDAENIQKAMMAAQVIGAATGLPIGQILGAVKGAATGDWLGAVASGLGAAGGLGMIDPSIGQYASIANNAAKGNWLGAAMGGVNAAGGLGNISNQLGLGGGGDQSIFNDYGLEAGLGDAVDPSGNWTGGGWNDLEDLGGVYDDLSSGGYDEFEQSGGNYNSESGGSGGFDEYEAGLGGDTSESGGSGGFDEYEAGGGSLYSGNGAFLGDYDDLDAYDPFQGGGGEIGGGGNMVGGGGDALFDDVSYDPYDPFQGQGGEIGGGGNMVGGGGDALFDTIDTYNPFGQGGGEIGGGGNLTGGGWQGPGGFPTGPTGPTGQGPYKPVVKQPGGTPEPPRGGLGGLSSLMPVAGMAINMFGGGKGPGGSKPPVSPQPPVTKPTASRRNTTTSRRNQSPSRSSRRRCYERSRRNRWHGWKQRIVFNATIDAESRPEYQIPDQ